MTDRGKQFVREAASLVHDVLAESHSVDDVRFYGLAKLAARAALEELSDSGLEDSYAEPRLRALADFLENAP